MGRLEVVPEPLQFPLDSYGNEWETVEGGFKCPECYYSFNKVEFSGNNTFPKYCASCGVKFNWELKNE